MSNQMIIGHNYNLLRGTILGGGTLSPEIDTMEFSLLGLIANTAMVACTLSFQVSANSDNDAAPNTSNYVDVKDNTGTVISFGPLSNTFALSGDQLAFLAPYRYIKIKSAVAQTNGVALLLPAKA